MQTYSFVRIIVNMLCNEQHFIDITYDMMSYCSSNAIYVMIPAISNMNPETHRNSNTHTHVCCSEWNRILSACVCVCLSVYLIFISHMQAILKDNGDTNQQSMLPLPNVIARHTHPVRSKLLVCHSLCCCAIVFNLFYFISF